MGSHTRNFNHAKIQRSSETGDRDDAAAGELAALRERQKQMEAKLRASEARLRHYGALFEESPVAHFVLARDSAIMQGNRQAAYLLGLPGRFDSGHRLAAFVDIDSAPILAAFLQRIFAGQTGNAGASCEIALQANSPGGRKILQIEGRLDAGRSVCNAIGLDITTTKAAEATAQKNLDLLTNLSAHIPGILFQYRLDPDGSTHFPYVSESIHRIYGITKEQAGEDAARLEARVHPEDQAGLEASMCHSASTAKQWHHEYRMLLPDGACIWRALDARPEKLANGSILWHGYTIDITERKRMEETLRASEERWKLALEGAGHGVWDWDLESNRALFSRRWKDILGYSEDEIGTDANEWMSRTHPDDQAIIEESHRAIVAHEKNSDSIEFRMRCKNGDWKWVQGSGILIARDDKGKTMRMVGTLSDISERKRVEEALRASEERWKFALEGAGDGVWDWNVTLGEITFSRRAREIMGHSEAEVPLRYEAWCARIHPDDMAHSLDNREKLMTQARDTSSSELRFRCKDGSWKWLLSRGMVVSRDENGTPLRLVGTISDISQRKETDEALRMTLSELEERRHEAERLSAAKSRFLNAASHDLRQPLYATQLFVDAIADATLTTSEQQVLENLRLSVKAMSAQLEMLLDVSRLDMGKYEPRLADIQLGAIFRDLEVTYAPIAHKAGVSLRFLSGSGTIHTDAVLIGRLLGNLIDNAIKFAEQGSVLVCARRSARSIRIEVRDNGPGIAPEHRPQIFDEYYQVGNPARNPSAGLGLGLSIAQRIARLLDVPLTLKTNLGQGTVFAIMLPTAACPRQTAGAPCPQPRQDQD